MKQLIQVFNDFTLNRCLKRPQQKPQFRVQLEPVFGHHQGAVDPRACESHFVMGCPFFVGAVHAKLFFSVFGPLKSHFSGTTQAQTVVAQDVKISHGNSPKVGFLKRRFALERVGQTSV